jgi:hypothetical protein
MSRTEWYQYSKSQRREIMEKIVSDDVPPGIMLVNEKEAEGWCAVAPMSKYPALMRSKVAYPIDGTDSWCISCFFVKACYRRQGRMTTLIRGAAQFAFSQGAPAVDGFPQVTANRTGYIDRFVGVESSFLSAGFKRVHARGPHRVAVRLHHPT